MTNIFLKNIQKYEADCICKADRDAYTGSNNHTNDLDKFCEYSSTKESSWAWNTMLKK